MQLDKWRTLLPQYPKWELGGKIELDDTGSADGKKAVSLHVTGVSPAVLDKYVEALVADGFIAYGGNGADIYYKMVDGVCRAFDKTDANQGDFISVSFFVGDYDKRAAAREKADAAIDTAKVAANAAKGLFKKFF